MVKPVIKKNPRKKFLEKECSICSKCTDRTACNNRQGYEKCAKCKACKTKCLKYCDRFYCYETCNGQIQVNGKQKTVATGKDRKEVEKQTMKKKIELDEGKFIDKNNTTLLEMLYLLEDSKQRLNKIKDSSYIRNYETIENIAKDDIANMKIQKITLGTLEEFFANKLYLSQSVVNKVYYAVNSAFSRAVTDKIISIDNNPMENIDKPISTQTPKKVTAFEIDEQIKILDYLSSNQVIVTPNKKADKKTLENCIKFLFATGCRCGEACAIDYTKSIHFDTEIIDIKYTLSKIVEKDKKGTVQFVKTKDNGKKPKFNLGIGTTTKTGKYAIKKMQKHTRELPFIISGDSEYMKSILESQIEIAKNNPNNTNNLLFCNKDGSFITTQQLTEFIKRICRELGIKMELETGCSIHMTKHTFVSRCIEAGIQLITISRLVGTSIQELERTYAHILDRFKNTELDKLQKYYKEVNLKLNKLKECYNNLKKVA